MPIIYIFFITFYFVSSDLVSPGTFLIYFSSNKQNGILLKGQFAVKHTDGFFHQISVPFYAKKFYPNPDFAKKTKQNKQNKKKPTQTFKNHNQSKEKKNIHCNFSSKRTQPVREQTTDSMNRVISGSASRTQTRKPRCLSSLETTTHLLIVRWSKSIVVYCSECQSGHRAALMGMKTDHQAQIDGDR